MHTGLRALIAFAGTTADDFLLLAVLFLSAGTKTEKAKICAGECIGILLTLLAGFAGGRAAGLLPGKLVRLLGLVPIAFAVLHAVKSEKDREEEKRPAAFGVIGTLLLALGSGGDNVAVYVPAFAGYNLIQMAVTFCVFAALGLLLCFAAERTGRMNALRRLAEKYGDVLICLVLAVLGILILLGY